MKHLHSIGEMREAARQRLPRMVFDYIDGGAGRERSVARNAASFEEVSLVPRVLAGAVDRSQSVELFGHTYSAPFGIAPLGLANVVRPGTDLALARAAGVAGVPYVLSTAASSTIESVAAVAPNSWFQLYVGRDAFIVDDLVSRAEAHGLPVLVVTADVPAPGKRVRDLVNGFTVPLRPSVRMAIDVMTHPRWSLSMTLGGTPCFANLQRYERRRASSQSLAAFMSAQCSARLDWDLLQQMRDRWPRTLVLKGILDPRDATRARGIGVDGLIVSNHGGRQIDSAPAPLEVLAQVRAAVGGVFPLLLDGGIRSGDDVIRALALGANAVLLGRGFLYAVAALGLSGPGTLIGLLRDEVDRVLAQIGCRCIGDLDGMLLLRRGELFDRYQDVKPMHETLAS